MCESDASPPPNREIDFDCACACVACVRASERSCVREMIPLWLGSGGEICGYPSVRPSGRRSRWDLVLVPFSISFKLKSDSPRPRGTPPGPVLPESLCVLVNPL